MFPTYIKAKLFAGVQAFEPLATMLTGPGSKLRWYDLQLDQDTLFPAVTVQVITNPKMYGFQSRVTTSWYRVQFTIWAQPDSAAADQVAVTMYNFLDQFNSIGIPGLSQYPCIVEGGPEGSESQLNPPVYKRVIQAMIFNNDTI